MIKELAGNRKAITCGVCFLITLLWVGTMFTLALFHGGQSQISRALSQTFTATFSREYTPQTDRNASPVTDSGSLAHTVEAQTVEIQLAEESEEETDFIYLSDIPLSHALQRYTYDRCESLGLEYEMVLAIMWRESMFQHDAVGVNSNGTRDSGLMQINDINRGWLKEKHGISDLLNPHQNIDAGTLMLSMFFSKYDETRALLCYQYGEQGMLERWEEGLRTNELTELVQDKRDEFVALRGSLESM